MNPKVDKVSQIFFAAMALPTPTTMAIYDSPYGALQMAFDTDGALMALGFADTEDRHPAYFPMGYFDSCPNRNDSLAETVWNIYTEVIPRSSLTIRLYGSTFSHQVWAELLRIPQGEVRTYGQVAMAIGCRSARAVGTAVGKNPISLLIPCHRVVGASNKCGGYRWGANLKLDILKAELGDSSLEGSFFLH